MTKWGDARRWYFVTNHQSFLIPNPLPITLPREVDTSKMSDTTSHGLLDRLFHLTENKTTVKRECLAGLTTFVSMAYILFVNPQILGDAGMDAGAVFTATALSAILGCLLM